MLDDILSALIWVGEKIIDFTVHGFRNAIFLCILLPLIIFILLCITYA